MSPLRYLAVPPLVGFGLIALAILLERLLPPAATVLFAAPVPGWTLIALGALLMGWALLCLLRAGTTFHPHREPTHLVVRGPFRATRNPIYLGDVCALAGLALLVGTPAFLLLPAVFALLIDRLFIRYEEVRLAERFPDEWERFRHRVRRWI